MLSKRHPFEPEMVPIPAGSFFMGMSDRQVDWLAAHVDQGKMWKRKGYFSREQPQHEVILPGFYIGRCPVMVGEYRAFVNAAGYLERRYWTDIGWEWLVAAGRRKPGLWDDKVWTWNDRLPVVGVSWHEAYAFCQWLSQATGRDYRLPSEAEWEKAARGTDDRLFPWGDVFDATRCNTRTSALKRTTPVGRYSPTGDSPYGCVDMAGNVSEWTLSQFKPYPFAPDDSRDDPHGDAERVIRGGSWHSPVLRVRVVARGLNDPFFWDNDVGFRCACSWM